MPFSIADRATFRWLETTPGISRIRVQQIGHCWRSRVLWDRRDLREMRDRPDLQGHKGRWELKVSKDQRDQLDHPDRRDQKVPQGLPEHKVLKVRR